MEKLKQIKAIIEKLLRSREPKKAFLDRLSIINLHLQGDKTLYSIKEILKIDWATANKWVVAWNENIAITEDIEKALEVNEIKESLAIKHLKLILSDKSRSGRKPKFTEAEIKSILALYATKPEDINLPFSHWTCSLLAEESINRGLVESISRKHVWTILKKHGH